MASDASSQTKKIPIVQSRRALRNADKDSNANAPETQSQPLNPPPPRKRKRKGFRRDIMSHDSISTSASNHASSSRSEPKTQTHRPGVQVNSLLHRHIQATCGPIVVCAYQARKQGHHQHLLQALPIHYAPSCFFSRKSEAFKTSLLAPVVATDSIETANFRNHKGSLSLLVDSLPPQVPRGEFAHVDLRSESSGWAFGRSSPHDKLNASATLGRDITGIISSLPVEIFDIIVQHLSPGDVMNLRLVSKAFERLVSANLFRSIVVPFNTDIFGVLSKISRHPSQDLSSHITAKAKGKQRASQTLRDLDIFRGFGSHVRQFAISFEVNEAALLEPPDKDFHQGHAAFWGDYEWPHPDYCRFSDRASLELTADETSTMTLAFSHLKNAQHLALSLDAGLGWMTGPDKSLRSVVLADRPPIFQNHSHQISADILSRRRFWISLEHWFASCGRFNELQRGAFVHVYDENPVSLHNMLVPPYLLPYQVLSQSPSIYPSAPGKSAEPCPGDAFTCSGDSSNVMENQGSDLDGDNGSDTTNTTNDHASTHSFHRLDPRPIQRCDFQRRIIQDPTENNPDVPESSLARFCCPQYSKNLPLEAFAAQMDSDNRESGYLCIQGIGSDEFKKLVGNYKLTPNNLTKAQKEWLLETAWAQDAFLSSYMLAIADNGKTFENLTRLTFSRVSSRHILKLLRHDFWGALPCLAEVDVRVIADWQDVFKGSAGNAEVKPTKLVDALNSFHLLLKTIVCRKLSIKRLTVGWVEGGEHAEGTLARNTKVLPAPIMNAEDIDFAMSKFESTVVFSAVEVLTLVNCWLTPNMFKNFLGHHVGSRLKELILDSVSLTADTRIPINDGEAQANAHGQFVATIQNHPNPPNAHAPIHFVQPQASGTVEMYGSISVECGVAYGPLHGTIQPPEYFPPDNRNSTRQNLLYPITAHGTSEHHGPGSVGPSRNLCQPHHQTSVLAQSAGLGRPVAGTQQANNPVNANNPNANATGAGSATSGPSLRRNCWPQIFHWLEEFWEEKTKRPLLVRLRSAGYVRLNAVRFEQLALEDHTRHVATAIISHPLNGNTPEAFYAERSNILTGMMMSSKESILGNIVTVLPPGEEDALLFEWDMCKGWPNDPVLQGADYDDEDGWGRWGEFTKRAALYDGNRPGGWGRFSGILSLNDDLDTRRREHGKGRCSDELSNSEEDWDVFSSSSS